LGIARAVNGQRICPACENVLDKPNDCAVAQLRPEEDYKGSILCGLSPSDIMECASRAITFFTYQSTQEM
jgi:E3 ubiquitin-protein ligase CCNP1IP1